MIRSVLVVKISAIGDVVMALPMLQALRERNPEVRIVWLSGKAAAPLLREIDDIDELIIIDEEKLLRGGIVQKIGVLVQVWTQLASRRFDLIVTGHGDSRYRLLSLPARAAVRRSFGVDECRRFTPIPGRHHTDEYVRLATGEDGPLALCAKLPVLRIPLPDTLTGLFSDGPTVALAPGGARNVLSDDAVRRWPIENYVQLAEGLVQRGVPIVLTGAPSDEWIVPYFDHLPVCNLVGKTDLVELIAVYGRCGAVVTHDSGPLHLAGLAGVPIIALFGPTNPYEKVPRSETTQIFWGGEDLPCRPCYDGRTYAPCTDNVCLKRVSPETIEKAVLRAIETHGLRQALYKSERVIELSTKC